MVALCMQALGSRITAGAEAAASSAGPILRVLRWPPCAALAAPCPNSKGQRVPVRGHFNPRFSNGNPGSPCERRR